VKCIRCGEEAEYIYVYEKNIAPIIRPTKGGSFCENCLEEIRREQEKEEKALMERMEGLESTLEKFES